MPTRKTTESTLTPGKDASTDALLRGLACYERREWHDAFEALSLADRVTPLGAEDLQRLAGSAALTAGDDEMLATQERLYRAHLEGGNDLAAARAAFWQGFRLLARGEPGQANGWLSRAQRIVESRSESCVEQGYLLLPAAHATLGGQPKIDPNMVLYLALNVSGTIGGVLLIVLIVWLLMGRRA